MLSVLPLYPGENGPIERVSLQTITPAAVGVFVLDDAVRSGWWPGAIGGFVLSAIGSLVLVRFESVKD